MFCIQIKAMAQHLYRLDKLNSQQRDQFSIKFMVDLGTLVDFVGIDICRHAVSMMSPSFMITYFSCLIHVDIGLC